MKRVRSKSSLGTRETTNLDNATASTPAAAEVKYAARQAVPNGSRQVFMSHNGHHHFALAAIQSS